MTQKMDIKHVYDLDDLKKFKESSASVEEVRKAYAMMAENKERREKATEELVNLGWKEFLLGRVKDLVEQGADVNAKDEYGRTPLYVASEEGHIDVVKYLLEHGADVKVKDKNGGTSLNWASWGSSIVRHLRGMKKLSLQRSKKAKEIRSVDADQAGQSVDHSLRRMLFGDNQLRRNAPLSPAVAARLKKHSDRS